jgi:hypothetical protein
VIAHAFKPDPHGRDVCDQKFDEDGRVEFCGQRRSEHMDETHALKIQLATALKERDEQKARAAKAEADSVIDQEARIRLARERNEIGEALAAAERERDALRTALTEVNDLLLSVPAGEDWRAQVRKKVIVALFGEAAWKET